MADSDAVKALLARALEVPEAERASFVRAEAGDDAGLAKRVLELLEHAEEATTLAGAASGGAASAVPERVGRYRIRGVLGEGGMGVVYRAAQDAPQREVALKLVRPGLASAQHLRRFELESEVLGRLAHPGIAQIFEAGIDEATGSPFFAMELVEGMSLTAYAERRKLGTRARLELFVKVCRAVQHAHAKGVIHRDLKPSNILVAEVGDPAIAQPKILDFGVARLTDSDLDMTTRQTDMGQLIGTVPYMSPEQVSGDVAGLDTRSDVYALGVVLYELLAGKLPYALERRLMLEMVRVITEEEPSRLSSVDTRFRGDVETIVGKALEKDKERRYQSASDLAGDLERYLGDEPIAARPPSASYQLRKFARRNRVLVGGVAATFVVLVLGIAASTGFAVVSDNRRVRAETAETAERERSTQLRVALTRAETAEGEERERADELEEVAGFQEDQLGGVDPDGMGLAIRNGLRDKLSSLAQRRGMTDEEIAAFLADYDTMVAGADFTTLALETLESEIFEPALEAIELGFEGQPVVRARLLQTVALTMGKAGLLGSATAPQREALTLYRMHTGDASVTTITAINNLGMLLDGQGQLDEAERLLQESMQSSRAALGPTHEATLASINNFGYLLESQGRFDEAETFAHDALVGLRDTLGEDDPATITAQSNVAFVSAMLGRYEDAEAGYREVVERFKRVRGRDHSDTLTAINNLGELLSGLGRFDEALPLLQRALDARRLTLGDEHPETVASINNMALVLQYSGRREEAIPYFEENLRISRKVLGDHDEGTLRAMNNFGSMLLSHGRFDEAAPYLEAAIAGRRRVLGPDHKNTMNSMESLGQLLRRSGKLDEAEPYYRDVLSVRQRVLPKDHPDTLRATSNLGMLLWSMEEFDEAEEYFRQSLSAYRRIGTAKQPATLTTIFNLGSLLMMQGEREEAELLLRESLDGRREVLSDDHPDTARSIEKLISFYDEALQWSDSESYRRLILDLVRADGELAPPALTSALVQLGMNLLAQDRPADAEPYLRECLDLRRALLEPGHWLIWNTQSLLGESLSRVGRFEEAEPMLTEAAEQINPPAELEGTAARRRLQAFRRVVDLFDARHEAEPNAGHDAEAAEWRTKLEAIENEAAPAGTEP